MNIGRILVLDGAVQFSSNECYTKDMTKYVVLKDR